MGQLSSSVRAFAVGGHPGDVLRHVNQLLPDLGPGLLASCCLIEVDPATRCARGVRAGPASPLRQADGRTKVLELSDGILLGVDSRSRYPVIELLLPPGCVLALYTEGLVKRPGSRIDHGIDRLRVSLAHADADSLDRLADRLFADILPLMSRADDVALLLTQPVSEA
jgi:hypothetical protein